MNAENLHFNLKKCSVYSDELTEQQRRSRRRKNDEFPGEITFFGYRISPNFGKQNAESKQKKSSKLERSLRKDLIGCFVLFNVEKESVKILHQKNVTKIWEIPKMSTFLNAKQVDK